MGFLGIGGGSGPFSVIGNVAGDVFKLATHPEDLLKAAAKFGFASITSTPLGQVAGQASKLLFGNQDPIDAIFNGLDGNNGGSASSKSNLSGSTAASTRQIINALANPPSHTSDVASLLASLFAGSQATQTRSDIASLLSLLPKLPPGPLKNLALKAVTNLLTQANTSNDSKISREIDRLTARIFGDSADNQNNYDPQSSRTASRLLANLLASPAVPSGSRDSLRGLRSGIEGYLARQGAKTLAGVVASSNNRALANPNPVLTSSTVTTPTGVTKTTVNLYGGNGNRRFG